MSSEVEESRCDGKLCAFDVNAPPTHSVLLDNAKKRLDMQIALRIGHIETQMEGYAFSAR